MDMIKERAGHTEFFQAYETVRNQVMELRRQRKAQRERLPVISPHLAAQLKLRRNKRKSKRRAEKKRKRFTSNWKPIFAHSSIQKTSSTEVNNNNDDQPPSKRQRTQ
jgi:hypothetical protein